MVDNLPSASFITEHDNRRSFCSISSAELSSFFRFQLIRRINWWQHLKDFRTPIYTSKRKLCLPSLLLFSFFIFKIDYLQRDLHVCFSKHLKNDYFCDILFFFFNKICALRNEFLYLSYFVYFCENIKRNKLLQRKTMLKLFAFDPKSR